MGIPWKRWSKRMSFGVVGCLALLAFATSACTCHGPVKPGPKEPVDPREPTDPPPKQCIPFKRGFVLPMGKKPERVVSVDWASHGTQFATVNEAGVILVRKHDSGIVEARYEAPLNTTISQIAFTPAGDGVLSAGSDGTVRLWKGGQEASSYLPPKARLNATSIAAGELEGAPFFVAAYQAKDGTGYVSWRSIDTNNPSVAARQPLATAAQRVALRPDGKVTAVGLVDGTILLFDTTSGQQIQAIQTPSKDAVRGLSWHASGDYLAAAGEHLWIWRTPQDLNAGQPTLLITDTTNHHTINDVAFSHDGKFLATVSGDMSQEKEGNFRFWSLAELSAGKMGYMPSPSTFAPTALWALAWNPVGPLPKLIYGTATGNSVVWVIDELPKMLLSMPLQKTNDPVQVVEFGLDLMTVAYGAKSGKVAVYEIQNRWKRSEVDLKQPVVSLQWDLDTAHYIALTSDGALHSYNWSTGNVVSSRPLGQTAVDMSLRRDGKAAAVALSDGSVAIVPPAPYTTAATILPQVHAGGVTAVRWSHDGELLATAGKDGKVKIWKIDDDVTKPTLLSTHQFPAGQHGTMARFVRGDKRLAIGATGGYLGIWQRHPQAWKTHALKRASNVIEWQNGRDRHLLTTGSVNGTSPEGIHMWNVKDADQVDYIYTVPQANDGHTGPIRSLAFSWNDQSLVTGSSDGSLKYWKMRRAYGVLGVTYASSPLKIVSRPKGAQLFMGTTNTFLHQVKLNASPAPTLRLTPAHEQAIPNMTLSKDGTRMLTAARDGRFISWDVTQQEPQRLHFYPNKTSSFTPATVLTGIKYNHDQSMVVTTSFKISPDLDSGQIAFWDVNNTDKPVQLIDGVRRVNCMAMHPSKNLIVTGHNESKIRVWERVNGKFALTKTLDIPHPLGTERIAFEPSKGKLLASTSRYGDIRIWRLSDGKQVLRLDSGGASVTGMSFHPAGTAIVVSLSTGQVKIWRLSDGKLLHRLVDPDIATPAAPHQAHIGGVTFSWSTAENVLYTAGGDFTIKQWTCPKVPQ